MPEKSLQWRGSPRGIGSRWQQLRHPSSRPLRSRPQTPARPAAPPPRLRCAVLRCSALLHIRAAPHRHPTPHPWPLAPLRLQLHIPTACPLLPSCPFPVTGRPCASTRHLGAAAVDPAAAAHPAAVDPGSCAAAPHPGSQRQQPAAAAAAAQRRGPWRGPTPRAGWRRWGRGTGGSSCSRWYSPPEQGR